MTNSTGRRIPAYAVKGGDMISGREVFDTRPALGGKFLILFTDGRRLELWSDETPVEIA